MHEALHIVRTMHWLSVGICLAMLFIAITVLDVENKYGDAADSLEVLSDIDFTQYYSFQNNIVDNFHYERDLFAKIKRKLEEKGINLDPDFVTLTVRSIPRSPHLAFGRSLPSNESSLRYVNEYLRRNADRSAETFQFNQQHAFEDFEALAISNQIRCVEHINFLGQTSKNDELYDLSDITGYLWRIGDECPQADELAGSVRLKGQWIEVPASSIKHWLSAQNAENILDLSSDYVVLTGLAPTWAEIVHRTPEEALAYVTARKRDILGDSISAFGFTVPFSMLLSLLPLLTLIFFSQIYLHLQHISRILPGNELAALSYPWVALFPVPLGATLAYLSFVPLPAVAMALLLFALFDYSSWIWFVSLFLSIGALSCSILAARQLTVLRRSLHGSLAEQNR